MRLLLISDLEGKFPTGLRSFCKREKIQAIISAGDLCGGMTKMIFENWELLRNLNKENKKKFDKRYGFARANKEIKKSFYAGKNLLKDLNSLQMPIYVVLGNADFTRRGRPSRFHEKEFIRPGSITDVIARLRNIIYIHNTSRKIGKYTLVGQSTLKKLNNKFLDKRNVIYVTHDPPNGSRFAKIENKASPRDGEDVGDMDITKRIKKYKPLIHIHGHMHEHWGNTKIGKTLSISSGFGYDGKAVILELNGKIKTKKVKVR